MTRENGFYWVRYEGEWVPAQWEDPYWSTCFSDGIYSDEEFDKVGERLTPPKDDG